MKKIILLILCFCFNSLYSQVNPTLGIGLETLTLNKGTIDVEVLTQIILKKQKELKNEALKRFMLKMFPDTNYTTRFYVQNCLNILLNEKNPQVIEKEILELTTNYAIALGVTKAIVEIDNTLFDTEAAKLFKEVDYQKLLDNVSHKAQIDTIVDRINKVDKLNDILITESQKEKPNLTTINKTITSIKCLEKEIKQIKRRLARKNINVELIDTNSKITTADQLNFGEKLDIVSLALSENDLLRKKGFFKNKINYREDQNYFYNETADDSIKNKIKEKIKHYVQNYDIIKNFMENNTLKNSDNIVENLNKIYLNQIDLGTEFYISNQSKTGDDVYKKAIDQLKSLLKLKSDLDHLITLQKTVLDTIHYKEFKNLTSMATITSIGSLQLIDKESLIRFKNQYNDLRTVYNYITEIKNTVASIIANANFNNNITNYKTIENIKIPTLNLINEAELNVAFTQLQTLLDELNTLQDNYHNGTYTMTTTGDDLKAFNDKILAFNKIVAPLQKNITDNKDKITSLYNNRNTIYTSIKAVSPKDLTDFVSNSMSQIKAVQEDISKLPDFFNFFINNLLQQMESLTYSQEPRVERDDITKDKITVLIATLYERLNYFKNNKNYTITDITFLENELLPQLVGIKYADSHNNKGFYDSLIKGIKNLTPLLKINILINKGLSNSTIKYDEKLISLFEFIGNLDKLDKAQTYASIVDLIKMNSAEITKILPDGAFKDSYNLFINGIKKYTLINPNAEKEYVEIDVVSFLDDMQQHYQRNNPSSFSLYLTLGLNQNMFVNKFQFSGSNETLSSIGFASEKIGVKYKILDFKKHRGYENAIKSDIYLNKRAPFINEWYTALYGSGLLYSLANTTTNQNFNFPHVGFATGFRFYNALDVNLMLGLPFIKDQKFGNNGFIGLGFDIPLGEYLEALGNK